MYLSGKFTNTMGWYKGSKIIYNAQTRMPHLMNFDGLNWGFIHTEYTITINRARYGTITKLYTAMLYLLIIFWNRNTRYVH